MELRAPKTGDEWEQYYELRYVVMNKPSGYSKESVYDKKDSYSFHIAAFDNGKIIGVGRLHFDDNDFSTGYVRFMAVLPNLQSKGIGSQILNKLEEIANEHQTKRMFLKSREVAIGFYQKNGYTLLEQCTDTQFETPHFIMEKYLLS